jgi:hypothetical protein
MSLENKALTIRLAAALERVDLTEWADGRGRCVAPPRQLWRVAFGTEPDVRQVAALGRSLSALGWQRSARNGFLVFIKELSNGRTSQTSGPHGGHQNAN